MKNILIYALVFALAFSFVIGVNAADDITVIINGTKIEFDVSPLIIDGRTMVPMRKTFEVLGAKVEWVAEMRLALATYKTSIIAMRIDEDSFTVTDVLTNSSQSFSLDVPAQIVNDRTLIPLRAVSEALGKTVEWHGDTRTAVITG